jgi:hypothetical protein
MINKIIISFMLTFTLLLVSNVESNGQCASCPSGYSPQSVPLDLGSGCVITIYYCMLCHPTGHSEAKLCGVFIPITCGVIDIDMNFWKMVREALIIDLATACDDEIGPCPERISFSIEEGFCLGIYPNHPTNPTGYIIKNCEADAGTCYKQYQVCYVGSALTYHVVNTYIVPGDCDFMEFEFDPNDPPYYCFTFCP